MDMLIIMLSLFGFLLAIALTLIVALLYRAHYS